MLPAVAATAGSCQGLISCSLHKAVFTVNSVSHTGAPHRCAAPCRRLGVAVLQVMYAYYASSSFGFRWPKAAAQQITTLQLTQMFVNLALLAASFYCCGCNFHISLWPSTVMYTAYAALFMVLFSQKYRKTTTGKQAGNTVLLQ